MKKEEYLSFKRLREICHTIADPRRKWGNKRHELVEILAIALLALMGGADSWEDLTLFGIAKEPILRTVFELKNGIPSPDTFRRVISRISPDALENLYRQWVRIRRKLFAKANLYGWKNHSRSLQTDGASASYGKRVGSGG